MHQTLQQEKFGETYFKYGKNILISSQKIPKSGFFGPKPKDFYFFTKLCSKTNSRTQISNMTTAFSNSNTKIRKSADNFGWKFKHFCFFLHEILQLDKSGVFISNMRILFSNSSQKYPSKTFLVPNLSIFVVFTKIFFTISVFAPNFATRQIRGCRFQIWQ